MLTALIDKGTMDTVKEARALTESVQTVPRKRTTFRKDIGNEIAGNEQTRATDYNARIAGTSAASPVRPDFLLLSLKATQVREITDEQQPSQWMIDDIWKIMTEQSEKIFFEVHSPKTGLVARSESRANRFVTGWETVALDMDALCNDDDRQPIILKFKAVSVKGSDKTIGKITTNVKQLRDGASVFAKHVVSFEAPTTATFQLMVAGKEGSLEVFVTEARLLKCPSPSQTNQDAKGQTTEGRCEEGISDNKDTDRLTSNRESDSIAHGNELVEKRQEPNDGAFEGVTEDDKEIQDDDNDNDNNNDDSSKEKQEGERDQYMGDSNVKVNSEEQVMMNADRTKEKSHGTLCLHVKVGSIDGEVVGKEAAEAALRPEVDNPWSRNHDETKESERYSKSTTEVKIDEHVDNIVKSDLENGVGVVDADKVVDDIETEPETKIEEEAAADEKFEHDTENVNEDGIEDQVKREGTDENESEGGEEDATLQSGVSMETKNVALADTDVVIQATKQCPSILASIREPSVEVKSDNEETNHSAVGPDRTMADKEAPEEVDTTVPVVGIPRDLIVVPIHVDVDATAGTEDENDFEAKDEDDSDSCSRPEIVAAKQEDEEEAGDDEEDGEEEEADGENRSITEDETEVESGTQEKDGAEARAKEEEEEEEEEEETFIPADAPVQTKTEYFVDTEVQTEDISGVASSSTVLCGPSIESTEHDNNNEDDNMAVAPDHTEINEAEPEEDHEVGSTNHIPRQMGVVLVDPIVASDTVEAEDETDTVIDDKTDTKDEANGDQMEAEDEGGLKVDDEEEYEDEEESDDEAMNHIEPESMVSNEPESEADTVEVDMVGANVATVDAIGNVNTVEGKSQAGVSVETKDIEEIPSSPLMISEPCVEAKIDNEEAIREAVESDHTEINKEESEGVDGVVSMVGTPRDLDVVSIDVDVDSGADTEAETETENDVKAENEDEMNPHSRDENEAEEAKDAVRGYMGTEPEADAVKIDTADDDGAVEDQAETGNVIQAGVSMEAERDSEIDTEDMKQIAPPSSSSVVLSGPSIESTENDDDDDDDAVFPPDHTEINETKTEEDHEVGSAIDTPYNSNVVPLDRNPEFPAGSGENVQSELHVEAEVGMDSSLLSRRNSTLANEESTDEEKDMDRLHYETSHDRVTDEVLRWRERFAKDDCIMEHPSNDVVEVIQSDGNESFETALAHTTVATAEETNADTIVEGQKSSKPDQALDSDGGDHPMGSSDRPYHVDEILARPQIIADIIMENLMTMSRDQASAVQPPTIGPDRICGTLGSDDKGTEKSSRGSRHTSEDRDTQSTKVTEEACLDDQGRTQPSRVNDLPSKHSSWSSRKADSIEAKLDAAAKNHDVPVLFEAEVQNPSASAPGDVKVNEDEMMVLSIAYPDQSIVFPLIKWKATACKFFDSAVVDVWNSMLWNTDARLVVLRTSVDDLQRPTK